MEALAGAKPLSARARRIARSREEMLGLLADFSGGGGGGDSESDHRELSFSDLVEAAVCRPNASTADPLPAAQKDRGCVVEAVEQRQQQEEAPAPSLKQQLAAAPRERRLRRRASDSRGSCGGSGDGVLLNFYVPGLLTRSMTMTTPRPCRRPVTLAAAGQSTPPTVAAGKARTIQAPLAVGCWPAWWGRGRGRRSSISKRV